MDPRHFCHLTNLHMKNLYPMLQTMVCLKKKQNKKKYFIINLLPTTMVVKIIPEDQISTGSPRTSITGAVNDRIRSYFVVLLDARITTVSRRVVYDG